MVVSDGEVKREVRRCFIGTGKTKGMCTAEAKEQVFPERSGIEWS